MNQEPILQAKGISKGFPGVQALEDVSCDIYPGEVHVLIGENGAGKSTLSKILMGAYSHDAGQLFLEGRPVRFQRPLDALKEGIGGVHQELMLVPWLNVAQNIFLNREPRRAGLFIDHRRMHEESRRILAELDVTIDTETPVKYLSTALQEMVEIAKILAFNPRVLILDEPTAVLTEREVKSLFRRIQCLKEAGVAIIYISHRLPEIRQIGDRITILRDGRHVKTVPMAEITNDQIVQLMVGRSLTNLYPRRRRAPGEEALRVEDLTVKSGPRSVDLEVYKGEIVGIAGLVGAGRSEVARAVFGIDKIEKGQVYLFGEPVTPRSPFQMVRQGVGLIPEDRKLLGLALKTTVAWNTVMASLRKCFPKMVVNDQKIRGIAEHFVKELRIATPGVGRQVRFLSGGNQQKVVLAKWLNTESKLLIFDEPTRGIDVGAKVEVHTLMDQYAQENAVLMISSDLPEVIGMSDRIYVMYQGRIVGHFRHEEATQDKIASLMLGVGVTNDASKECANRS
jgi:ribose transport system ATP-binding protein